jgi:hypothetical protein
VQRLPPPPPRYRPLSAFNSARNPLWQAARYKTLNLAAIRIPVGAKIVRLKKRREGQRKRKKTS